MFNMMGVRRLGRAPVVTALLATAMVFAAARGSCVSDEELDAAQKDLDNEKALSQSLEAELATERANVECLANAVDAAAIWLAELATERANVERLAEAVDAAEVRLAEKESELAKERATIGESREMADAAEAETTVLSAFLAWNRKDQEGFAANFIGNGMLETALAIPSSLGDPSIALRRLMDATVSGDTATIHAMFALGTQRNSVLYSLAKQDGVWKIECEERLSPKIKSQTVAADVRFDGCGVMSTSERMIERNVAFTVENTG